MKSQETERNEINTAYRWHTITDGCDGVAVSTVGCGPASPGSIPGHGPIFIEELDSDSICNLKLTKQILAIGINVRRNFITASESLKSGWDAYGRA